MNLKHIIYSLLCALVISVNASAQVDTRRSGNMIVTAVEFYNEGDFSKASAVLDRLLQSDPSNDAAWYYLAMCSLAGGDLELAESRLCRALELDPVNFWYRYRLAGIYAMTSRPELTVEIYEKLLVDFPKKSELYFDIAELYSARNEYEKALKILNEIETVLGMTESVAVYRFNLLMRMQKQEEAYRSLEAYNSRYSSPYVLSTLAEHQLSMYNDSTALAYYNEALDIAPDYAPALLGKAETFRMTRRYDEYFNVLNDFVAAPSDVPKSKTDYLSAVMQRSDAKFLRAFMSRFDVVMDKIVEIHPKDSSVLHLAGIYYHSTGRKEKAKARLYEGMVANPSSLSATASYLEFLHLSKEWAELSSEGRAAFGRFPKEPALLEMASMGDYNLQAYDKVLEICDKILEVAPSDSARTLWAWSTKGDLYHQLGEPKKSYKAYEMALKINPGHVYVLNNYAYYLCMEGKNLKKACEMSRKTIEAEPDNPTYLDTYGWILFLMGRPDDAKPHFKHAMLYGGKDSVVILDHYAEVLFALGEYERAMVYWNQALYKNNGEIPDLEEKIDRRKLQIKNKKDGR